MSAVSDAARCWPSPASVPPRPHFATANAASQSTPTISGDDRRQAEEARGAYSSAVHRRPTYQVDDAVADQRRPPARRARGMSRTAARTSCRRASRRSSPAPITEPANDDSISVSEHQLPAEERADHREHLDVAHRPCPPDRHTGSTPRRPATGRRRRPAMPISDVTSPGGRKRLTSKADDDARQRDDVRAAGDARDRWRRARSSRTRRAAATASSGVQPNTTPVQHEQRAGQRPRRSDTGCEIGARHVRHRPPSASLADDRHVVVPARARGRRRAARRRADDRLVARQPVDTDVEKAADRRGRAAQDRDSRRHRASLGDRLASAAETAATRADT